MIISKTPLRMSFAGGGSDLHAYYQHGYGAVTSTTIDKYMYVMINDRFTKHIRIGYSQVEHVDNVDEIEHDLVREVMKFVDVTEKVEINLMTDILPTQKGSGLGASSSILVGILHALHAFKGEDVSSKQLAQEACEIEIEILGNPIGKQDQYAAAYGGLNWIQFNADESVIVYPVGCKPEIKAELNRNLLLFYTGMISRTSDVLPEQREKTKKNLEVLDKMVALAADLRRVLGNNDLTEFGTILHQGWLYKQKLASKITNPLINSYYENARETGAIGGKILGSGGGGFLLLYCPENKQREVRKSLANLQEVDFEFDHKGSRIVYNDR
ncbi:GHMP kinase [Candidatus Heimdallarchaeota archaeon B3_Heim]|nr:MAG: GHMP kinase [Candidatus Heimdallarchaeota archaeon B3_Heim]